MKRLKEHRHMLHVLKDCNSNTRKQILKKSNKDLVQAICEVCLNVLHGNIKLSKKNKQFLHKHKKTIRELATSKHSIAKKRKTLVQRGGFLPVLLGSVLSGVVAKLIEDQFK